LFETTVASVEPQLFEFIDENGGVAPACGYESGTRRRARLSAARHESGRVLS